ncbi:hypothetical protein GCM10011340_18330 [Roseivirga thermotolerans]|uniref:Uncharacterized protein n=1 Tax=Roseivirga thermotolerans TaxID=1758176 RepID=A0ABQ3I4H1_9BACT|nr:hypothetical protein GCM10011340_18330 [Roseivirga thermotolerans]
MITFHSLSGIFSTEATVPMKTDVESVSMAFFKGLALEQLQAREVEFKETRRRMIKDVRTY